jgi:cytochrome c oxidase subunit 3
MAEGVKHDYHLVNPSPWPLIGSLSCVVMAFGGVTWMKGLFGLPQHTSWLFFAGLAGVLYTFFGRSYPSASATGWCCSSLPK